VKDYSDLLEQARRSRLVLVKDLVAALEAEIAENDRLRTVPVRYRTGPDMVPPSLGANDE
jgi:hypothetical protein